MHELDPERWPAGQADTAGLTCNSQAGKNTGGCCLKMVSYITFSSSSNLNTELDHCTCKNYKTLVQSHYLYQTGLLYRSRNFILFH